jgi:hypothetical protein
MRAAVKVPSGCLVAAAAATAAPDFSSLLSETSKRISSSTPAREKSFRAWWAKPAAEIVPCSCGWRPDLGDHYRVHRPGPTGAAARADATHRPGREHSGMRQTILCAAQSNWWVTVSPFITKDDFQR